MNIDCDSLEQRAAISKGLSSRLDKGKWRDGDLES